MHGIHDVETVSRRLILHVERLCRSFSLRHTDTVRSRDDRGGHLLTDHHRVDMFFTYYMFLLLRTSTQAFLRGRGYTKFFNFSGLTDNCRRSLAGYYTSAYTRSDLVVRKMPTSMPARPAIDDGFPLYRRTSGGGVTRLRVPACRERTAQLSTAPSMTTTALVDGAYPARGHVSDFVMQNCADFSASPSGVRPPAFKPTSGGGLVAASNPPPEVR